MFLTLIAAASLQPSPGPHPPTDDTTAQADPVELSWQAPTVCPDAHEVLRQHDELSSDAVADGTVQVRAVVEQRGATFHETLEITVDGEQELHEFEGPSCVVLGRATALLIAIAVDPIQVVNALEPQVPEPEAGGVPRTTGPSQRAEEALDPPSAPMQLTKPVRASPAWHVDVGLRGGARWGGLPGLGAVAGGAVGLEREAALPVRLRLELGADYATPTAISYSDREGLGARLDLWTVNSRACLSVGREAVSIPLCAGAAVGQLRARASGTADAHTDRSAWVAATAEASLRWRFAPAWFFSVGLEVSAPLLRETFHFDEAVDPVRSLYEVGPVALVPHAGFAVQAF